MPAYLEIYDGASLAGPLTITGLGPGDTSATESLTLWNDKGGAHGADTSRGLRLVAAAYNSVLGAWVRSGLNILDQGWIQCRITGTVNTEDPTFPAFTTSTRRIGANMEIELDDLPPNCGYNFDFSIFAPASIDTAATLVQIIAIDQENSFALAHSVGRMGSGILPEWRDASRRRIVTGATITASGAASVVVSESLQDYDGARVASIESTHTLNQNDGAAAALAAGQSYIAVISINAAGARTATKGVKGTSPTAPATPAAEIYVGEVTVDHQVGGTSIIDQADVDQGALIRGDYYLEAGSGLVLNIHSGRGISSTSQYQRHGIISTLSLTASDTSYIWLRPDGNFEDNVTGIAPDEGAHLFAEVDCDGSAITAIRDRRSYLTRPWDLLVLDLRLGTVSGTSSAPLDFGIAPDDAEIDELRFEGTAVSGGGADTYICEVATAPEGEPAAGTWTTIFTSSGTQDLRPTIAYNATVLAASAKFHEVRRVTKGQRIGAWVPAIPAGGTLTGARCFVLLRRYR